MTIHNEKVMVKKKGLMSLEQLMIIILTILVCGAILIIAARVIGIGV